ncbi:MAG: hypothetical protein WA542_00685 [Candidatus Acidiferrum sp.]
MSTNTDGAVAAIHYAKGSETLLQPTVLVLAAKGRDLEIFPYVAVNDNADVFKTATDYFFWRNKHVKELRASVFDGEKEVDKKWKGVSALHTDALIRWLDGAGTRDLIAVHSNKALALEIKSTTLKLGWKGKAKDTEAELREAGSLFVNFNPAFEWLRSADTDGPAQTCYLQAIYLAQHFGLTDLSSEEREQQYMDQFSDGQLFTFRW